MILKNIISFFKNTFLSARFFMLIAVVICLYGLSFVWSFLFAIAHTALFILLIATVVDVLLLYSKKHAFSAERLTQKLLSNGDDNPVELNIENNTRFNFKIDIYDELPVQLQQRDFHFALNIKAKEDKKLKYTVHPTERGAYAFGNLNILFTNFLALVIRRQIIDLKKEIPVYPSIIQMKKFELKLLEKASIAYGIKRVRRIGQSYEFEQIKTYVQGDDFRKINWKATGKHNQIMVNQYIEERSQSIYCFIDKSRNMKLPFYNLSLFDYAINASLVLTNISLQKQDRAGFVSFSDKLDSFVKASNNRGQLRKILENLYRQKENYVETNYEYLYANIRKRITNRSLIFLFTNFESLNNLKRNISVLRKMNRLHLLVVIFFENTEISNFKEKEANNLSEIYTQTIAEKFNYEKIQIVQELKKYGIQAIYTKPEDLTVNTINKYLEIKARGLL
ncbi:MAG: DUF58 domain-containing protein [Chitinophagales bacterium]